MNFFSRKFHAPPLACPFPSKGPLVFHVSISLLLLLSFTISKHTHSLSRKKKNPYLENGSRQPPALIPSPTACISLFIRSSLKSKLEAEF
ncbi:hypothetical protein LXL04_012652 [Taraxacum kok-saghyz]